jgi:hypothetical protein
MKNKLFRFRKNAFCIALVVLTLCLTNWIGGDSWIGSNVAEAKVEQMGADLEEYPPGFDKANPAIQAVIAVQKRHTDILMTEPGILGTAVGLGQGRAPLILVFAKSFNSAKRASIPDKLEGVPVIVKVTGEIRALKRPTNKGPKPKEEPVDATSRFIRPVTIGVSTGHPDITAGTIGCRVTDGSNVYALSNNHVYADENQAFINDYVLQPGAFDGGEVLSDVIGTLSDFEPIDFSGGENTIDAAIALSTVDYLSNSTPSDGYGTPKTTTAKAYIGMLVMKYGRTTQQTNGRVYAINATVTVGYDSGDALFVNQIIITPGNFSAPGDSGSLIVGQRKKDARKPVGLLFAGSDTMTVANPIDAVLNHFVVRIDSE